jgi:DsbC/DsbD-like thiol-disulfide interchange protein
MRKWLSSPRVRLEVWFSCVALFFCFVLQSLVVAEDIDPVQVQLNFDPIVVIPGTSLNVAVVFSIAHGWHIYGRTIEGSLGLPTTVNFQAVDLTFDAADWEPEQEFIASDDTRTHGYAGNTRVRSTAQVSRQPKNNSTIIRAQVSWLACSVSLCVPGKQILEKEIRIEARSPVATSVR